MPAMTTTTEITSFEDRVTHSFGEAFTTMGDNQKSMLRGLAERGEWHKGSSWAWSNESTTVRLLNSLVKRGLAMTRQITCTPLYGKAYSTTQYRPVPGVANAWSNYTAERDRARKEREIQEMKQTQIRREEMRAEADALEMLKSFSYPNGGWLCDVTISVDVNYGENQQQAIEKLVEVLRAAGVEVRPTRQF